LGRKIAFSPSNQGARGCGPALKNIAHEGLGKLSRALKRAHVQDRFAPEIGRRSTPNLLAVLARLEGDKIGSRLGVDPFEEAQQSPE
jgi:hypothetical protein